MDVQRAGRYALVIASIAMFALISVHPAHGGGAAIVGSFSLQGLVHGLALLIAPIGAFGAFALAQHIGWNRPLSVLAVVFYLMGSVAVMAAATMSGLVTSEAVAAAHEAIGTDRSLLGKIGRLSVWINRGFANVHVAYFSLAMLLWDLGWKRHVAIRATGIAGAVSLLAWQLSGTFEPNVHTMPLVVGIQGLWAIGAAACLLRRTR